MHTSVPHCFPAFSVCISQRRLFCAHAFEQYGAVFLLYCSHAVCCRFVLLFHLFLPCVPSHLECTFQVYEPPFTSLSRKSSQASSVASGYCTSSGYGAYPSVLHSAGPACHRGTRHRTTLCAPPRASVSRASSVTSSPALLGASLGAEGRCLSRSSTTASQRVLCRTASGGSSSSRAGTGAGDASAGVYEGRESTVLLPCAAVLADAVAVDADVFCRYLS
ncbi:hypothetical protein JB92DRAFT_3007057 [Gautieria morchelliformis]|nr:hypothetical protein JB92DRAFT_3007057 [Gautieria morchelliformis]